MFTIYNLFLGCNLNYHKRCVVKLLNDCGGGNKQKYRYKSSTSNLSVSPRSPSSVSLVSAVSDESVNSIFILHNFIIFFILNEYNIYIFRL